MSSTYRLIKDPIPVYHSFDGGVIFDSQSPYIYIASRSPSGPVADASYLYKYNRDTLHLDRSAAVANHFSPFGPCALDRDQRLYFSPNIQAPAGKEYHAAFDAVTLELIARARRDNAGTCELYSSVSGGYITPPPECPHKVWWHYDNTDLFAGSIDCFAQDIYCPPAGTDFKAPKFLYFVPQTAFDVPGGFSTTGMHLRAVASDGAANLWVYFSGLISGTGEHKHQLWVVRPVLNFEHPTAPVVEFKLDLAPLIPNPNDVSDGRMRWFADDNSLIICNGYGWVKYDIASGTVTQTLNTFAVPGRIPPTGNTNRVSFTYRHPFVKSIWVGSFLQVNSAPPPPNGFRFFPHFMEVRMADLTVGRILTSTEIGAEYPPNPTGGDGLLVNFLTAHEAILDPLRGELWCSTNNRSWLAAFQFTEVPPGEGIPPDFPPGKEPYCIPRNKDFDPRTHRRF